MAKKAAKKSKATRKPKAAAAAVEAKKIAATIAEVARHFEVHERTVKSWFAKGCPHERGAYDVAAIEAWRESNVAPADEDAGGERGIWETRRSRAEALKKELDLEVARGNLIEVQLASTVIGRHVAEVKAHLNQLPAFAASLVKLSAEQKRNFLAALAKKVHQLCEGFEQSLVELSGAANNEDVSE